MATKYLLASATGSGNGNDWTNAYTTTAALIAGLSRGDTAYIGDGSYGGITFSTANSGATVITVKKATASDHGTDTGWDPSFGDGQAQFSSYTFSSDYWTIDGQTGGGPGAWNSGFGFYVYSTSSILCSFPASRSNISISHVDFNSNRTNFYAGLKGVAGASNITVSRCAFRNIFGPVFHIGSWTDCTMEYLYCYYNRSTPEEHAEGVSSIGTNTNITWRWSIWDRIEGTAVFAGVNVGASVGWKIYGNVFARSNTTIYYYWEVPGTNQNSMTNSYFVNNTIYDMPNTSQGNLVIQNGSGNVAYNNLYYNNTANSFANYMTHDYSFASDNKRTEGGLVDKDAEVVSGEANGQISTGAPFFAYSSDPLLADFASVTEAGLDTGAVLAENDVDWSGVSRGVPDVWSRGAVQYPGGPAAPTDLSATAAGSSGIGLTWTDNASDETGVYVERSTNQSTWLQVAALPAGAVSFSDSGLYGGTTYYYRVRTFNGYGASGYSATANATTEAAPTAGNSRYVNRATLVGMPGF